MTRHRPKKRVIIEFVLVKLSSLTRFVENIINIYISKYIYYKNIFNDSSNDTNYALTSWEVIITQTEGVFQNHYFNLLLRASLAFFFVKTTL
jgi:hypothetical protein